MEVLIAMGIFLIGIISVAAIFPAAVMIQRDTFESLTGQQVNRRAQTTLRALAASGVDPADALTYHHDFTPGNRRGTLSLYTYSLTTAHAVNGDPRRLVSLVDYGLNGMNVLAVNGDTWGASGTSGDVPEAPVTNYNTAGRLGFSTILSQAMTSFPSHGDTEFRDYYWFPLIQAGSALTDPLATNVPWNGYVIVMHRQPNMRVPQVRYTNAVEDGGSRSRIDWSSPVSGFNNDTDNDGTPDLVKPGDFILGDNGLVHRVLLADGDGCTVDSAVLENGGIPLGRVFFVVAVDAQGRVEREGPSPVAWISDPFTLPVQDPGP